jgi:hypothetical protein
LPIQKKRITGHGIVNRRIGTIRENVSRKQFVAAILLENVNQITIQKNFGIDCPLLALGITISSGITKHFLVFLQLLLNMQ